MFPYRAASLLSPVHTPFLERLVAHCSQATRRTWRFDASTEWTQIEQAVLRDEVDLLFGCGLWIARRLEQASSSLEVIAAPVMAAERYGGQPIYFSDVIVRADSKWTGFADLRGQRWGINEPGSYSGYLATLHALFERGEHEGYFSDVQTCGSHVACIEAVLRREIDGAAIDSTVLEEWERRFPEQAKALRKVALFGPSPIPPVAVSQRVPERDRRSLQRALVGLSSNPVGAQLLKDGMLRAFVATQAREYDVLLDRARSSSSIRLSSISP